MKRRLILASSLYKMRYSILSSMLSGFIISFLVTNFSFPFFHVRIWQCDALIYTGLIHPCHIHRTTHRQTNSRRFLFGSIYSWGRRQESHCVVRNLDLLRRETVGDAYLWVCMRKGLIHCVLLDKETLCIVGLEQRCNQWKIFGGTFEMLGRICPPWLK